MIQLRRGYVFAEDISADEPGEIFLDLEGHEAALGDGEDEIEIFEGAAFGFFDKEEDEDEGDDVEAGEETEGSAVTETSFFVADRGVENGEKAGEKEVDRDGPGGAGFSMREGETFRSEGEGDGAETRGISDSKHLDD